MENENQEFAATSYHEIGHAVADYILYGKLHRFNHIHIGHYDAECEWNGDIDITSIDFYRAVGDEKNLKKERKRLKDLYNFNKLTH